MNLPMFRLISIALLLLGTGVFPTFAAAINPGRIELAENWKLASATEALASGAAISAANYRDAKWHPIRRMPATVLEILQEDGVYTNLYFGKNLEIGGIARRSKRSLANPTRSNCRASITALKSGLTARRLPTVNKSSACMSPTN
jgi:hypothetical protein